MSFQGDVGGIGLADLLQSLARGRDGVLSLLGKEGLKSTLGFQDGQIHLLPDPEEDPEMWRHRARQAWVKDPDFRIDSLRMTEIARAARTEMLYRLLDSEGVHFRFSPGSLPERPSDAALSAAEPGTERKGPRRDAVYVQGASVEGMLLEFARLKDEAQSAAVEWPGFEDAVLIGVDAGPIPKDRVRFWNECDGQSSLSEIADRLGWPLRQLRLTAITELQRGAARLAAPDELLLLAQNELAQGYADRAAARVRSWITCAPFGPLSHEDASVFRGEWEAGRLQPMLRSLSATMSRTFLRRLDAALGSPLAALDHWAELVRLRREDRIAVVRLVHMQTIASADPNVPAVRDLLAMSRAFLENERRFAAAAILRIVATKAPESTSVRLEIGLGMLAAGLGTEAGPWILDAATALLETGDAERALPPLREYVAIDPGNREARRLLSRARARSVKRTLVKKNSLVAIAVFLALSIGAIVQFRSQREFDAKLVAVNARLDDPSEALRILDEKFKGEDGARVGQLRNTLVEKKKIADAAARTAWTDRYREAQVECTLGDPVLGLRRTLDLPPPPDLGARVDPLPLVPDLYNSLAARIETQVTDLGTKIEDTPAQTKAEGKVLRLLLDLREPLHDATAKTEAADFARRIDAFETRIKARDEKRAKDRAAREKKDSLAQQDILIGAARAHAFAGDFERSLQLFSELIASDTTGKLGPLLQREINLVREKSAAVARAAELSRQGKQQQAHDLLKTQLKDAVSDRTFSWKIDTLPTHARVHLGESDERVTPFTLETSWDEPVALTIELAGHETVKLVVEHPADQFVLLSRIPERTWNPGGRVEALPVRVGEDHVVCDRNGHLARLSKGSTVVWNQDLHSLGGIARAPVFLPRDPGHLLVVTEDGDVWIATASTGELEGPWTHGAPPVAGPVVGESGVRVRFRDDTTFEWSARLKPEVVIPAEGQLESNSLAPDTTEGSNSGLAVLRRRTSSSASLASPWTEYVVDVGETAFSVRAANSTTPLFTAMRSGDWTFVAWESPNALLPRGRLWTSDGKGLRSYTP